MQNTRLSSLLGNIVNQADQFRRNPWRRLSLLAIALLFGIYLGTAIASTAGQTASLDVVVAALVLLFTEALSLAFYSGRWNFRQSILGESLNTLKFGLIYGLLIIAFILGS